MQTIRCAIYTRKSTDEGLDKEFNTLEAQRESALNYIKSQIHQGWIALPEIYDDGGFSGGNMNRPAFQRLLSDIKAGKIDMIVVYKIDRLTRSLVDFSKLIEVLDAHNCSFVSVTQNFNTSDSMGRLTLNVLLSFAQFEREVSGERIRDKIKASRQKGMWTGGVVPYGYTPIDKKLVIKEDEAEAVRFMFEMYLKHRSSMAVCKLLNEYGYKTLRRDAVKRMLKNPLYVGKVRHKNAYYDGQHQPIVSKELFDEVQNIRTNKPIAERSCVFAKNEVGLLRGLLTCGCCKTPMSPASSQTRGVRRFYYTSIKSKYYGSHTCNNGAIPVPVLDDCIIQLVLPLLKNTRVLHALIQKIAPQKTAEIFKVMQKPEKILAQMPDRLKHLLIKLLIEKIIINYDTLELTWTELGESLTPRNYRLKMTERTMTMPLPFIRRRGALQVALPEEITPNIYYNAELVRAISKSFKYRRKLHDQDLSISELAFEEKLDAGYLGRLLRLTCLAPDIIKSILAGTQPQNFLLQPLLREDIPPIWEDQRQRYKFPTQ